MSSNGGPAFAAMNETCGQDGMSLRDYFAAKAMQAFLSDITRIISYKTALSKQGVLDRDQQEKAIVDRICQSAFRYADAMLAERDKESHA